MRPPGTSFLSVSVACPVLISHSAKFRRIRVHSKSRYHKQFGYLTSDGPGSGTFGFEAGYAKGYGEETKSKLEELEFLEKSIGATGKLAIKPFMQMSQKDLWKFYMLSD